VDGLGDLGVKWGEQLRRGNIAGLVFGILVGGKIAILDKTERIQLEL
jgi:hypothetical protein